MRPRPKQVKSLFPKQNWVQAWIEIYREALMADIGAFPATIIELNPHAGRTFGLRR